MKSIAMTKHVELSEEAKKKLKLELKETKVEKTDTNGQTRFTVVDLWNRHRNGRSASSMMRRSNLN